jgi:hypothetical protein
MRESQNILHTLLVGLGHRIIVERTEIGLDRRIQLVEHIVQPFGLGYLFAIAVFESVTGTLHHAVEHVDQPQRFTCCGADRHGRDVGRSGIEVDRLCRISRIDTGGEPAAQ